MGLDMYAYSVPAEYVVDDFEFKKSEDGVKFKESEDGGRPEDIVEISYWRKHRHLHNYMEKLYREKGGTAESFNCVPVRLTLEDLDKLEDLIKSEELKDYGNPGFFFGSSDLYEHPEDKKRDLVFILEARLAIEDGKAVYYDSWW